MRLSAILVLMIGMGSSSANAACHTDPFRFYFGEESKTLMRAESGQACKIRFFSAGMREWSVSTPSHGAVSTNGSIVNPELVYVARRGYAGSDEFVITVSGEWTRGSTHHEGPATVDVSVEVQ